jgi:hypothetical protein
MLHLYISLKTRVDGFIEKIPKFFSLPPIYVYPIFGCIEFPNSAVTNQPRGDLCLWCWQQGTCSVGAQSRHPSFFLEDEGKTHVQNIAHAFYLKKKGGQRTSIVSKVNITLCHKTLQLHLKGTSFYSQSETANFNYGI